VGGVEQRLSGAKGEGEEEEAAATTVAFKGPLPRPTTTRETDPEAWQPYTKTHQPETKLSHVEYHWRFLTPVSVRSLSTVVEHSFLGNS
jgi:hypothetical protein